MSRTLIYFRGLEFGRDYGSSKLPSGNLTKVSSANPEFSIREQRNEDGGEIAAKQIELGWRQPGFRVEISGLSIAKRNM